MIFIKALNEQIVAEKCYIVGGSLGRVDSNKAQEERDFSISKRHQYYSTFFYNGKMFIKCAKVFTQTRRVLTHAISMKIIWNTIRGNDICQIIGWYRTIAIDADSILRDLGLNPKFCLYHLNSAQKVRITKQFKRNRPDHNRELSKTIDPDISRNYCPQRIHIEAQPRTCFLQNCPQQHSKENSTSYSNPVRYRVHRRYSSSFKKEERTRGRMKVGSWYPFSYKKKKNLAVNSVIPLYRFFCFLYFLC